jgi:hypothetical protein
MRGVGGSQIERRQDWMADKGGVVDPMAFYKPKLLNAGSLRLIVYQDEELTGALSATVLGQRLDEIAPRLSESPISPISYSICFAWQDKGDLMIDAWLFGRLDTWNSGPLVDVMVFRERALDREIGVGSGNSLIVLGLEESARRNARSFEDYLTGQRPCLPRDLEFRSTEGSDG